MARSYYSMILRQSANEVLNIIRDFNSYPVWVDGAGDRVIEAKKSDGAVGAVRSVLYGGRRIRQQLLSRSDATNS